MIKLGLLSLGIAFLNFIITIYFVIKREEVKSIKFRLAYGALMIILCGVATLLFEVGLNYFAEGLMLLAFLIYIFTTIRNALHSKIQRN